MGSLEEARVRRLARTLGFALRKSRARNPELLSFGGFMLIDLDTNTVVAGAHPYAFSLTLEEAEAEVQRFRLEHAATVYMNGPPGWSEKAGVLRAFKDSAAAVRSLTGESARLDVEGFPYADLVRSVDSDFPVLSADSSAEKATHRRLRDLIVTLAEVEHEHRRT